MQDFLPAIVLSNEHADSGEAMSEWTRSLVQRDEEAWRTFFSGWQRRLRYYLAVIWHGPDEDLDDLVQMTFLRAVKYMRVFSSEEALWSWLTVLARSVVIDAGRKRSRFRRLLDRFSKERDGCAPSFLPDLETAMSRLPQGVVDLLRMKYEEERSVREMARTLGISEKATESRLTRARALLRKELALLP